MTAIFDRLKKTAPLPLYFLYGTEEFLIEGALNVLKAMLVQPSFKDLNCQTFHVNHIRESDISPIISASQTMPFMSDRRVIIVKGAEGLNDAQSLEMLEYVKNPCPAASLILIANTGKIDKKSALFSELEKKGCSFAFNSLSKKELPLWIKTEIKNRGKDISNEAVAYLINAAGEGLMDLKGEIDKLTLFVGDKKIIDLSDVETVVSDIKMNSIFDFTDSVGKKDFKAALKALDKIIADGEIPIKILGMIARQFRILLKIKTLKKRNTPQNKLASLAGVSPYFLDNYIKQVSRFTEDELLAVFNKLHKTDIALKSERLQGLILERLVMELCIGV